jgi:hypothetical protein
LNTPSTATAPRICSAEAGAPPPRCKPQVPLGRRSVDAGHGASPTTARLDRIRLAENRRARCCPLPLTLISIDVGSCPARTVQTRQTHCTFAAQTAGAR